MTDDEILDVARGVPRRMCMISKVDPPSRHFAVGDTVMFAAGVPAPDGWQVVPGSEFIANVKTLDEVNREAAERAVGEALPDIVKGAAEHFLANDPYAGRHPEWVLDDQRWHEIAREGLPPRESGGSGELYFVYRPECPVIVVGYNGPGVGAWQIGNWFPDDVTHWMPCPLPAPPTKEPR